MIDQAQFRIASLLVKIGNAVTYYRNRKMEYLDLTSVQSDVLIDILRNPGITASGQKSNYFVNCFYAETDNLMRKSFLLSAEKHGDAAAVFL